MEIKNSGLGQTVHVNIFIIICVTSISPEKRTTAQVQDGFMSSQEASSYTIVPGNDGVETSLATSGLAQKKRKGNLHPGVAFNALLSVSPNPHFVCSITYLF